MHFEPQRHNSEALTYIGYVLAKIAERLGVPIDVQQPILTDDWVYETAYNYHWATTRRPVRTNPDHIIDAITGNFRNV